MSKSMGERHLWSATGLAILAYGYGLVLPLWTYQIALCTGTTPMLVNRSLVFPSLLCNNVTCETQVK